MAGGLPMVEWLNQRLPQEQVNQAFSTLDKLHRVVHAEKIVAFYEERSQELEKVPPDLHSYEQRWDHSLVFGLAAFGRGRAMEKA